MRKRALSLRPVSLVTTQGENQSVLYHTLGSRSSVIVYTTYSYVFLLFLLVCLCMLYWYGFCWHHPEYIPWTLQLALFWLQSPLD